MFCGLAILLVKKGRSLDILSQLVVRFEDIDRRSGLFLHCLADSATTVKWTSTRRIILVVLVDDHWPVCLRMLLFRELVHIVEWLQRCGVLVCLVHEDLRLDVHGAVKIIASELRDFKLCPWRISDAFAGLIHDDRRQDRLLSRCQITRI